MDRIGEGRGPAHSERDEIVTLPGGDSCGVDRQEQAKLAADYDLQLLAFPARDGGGSVKAQPDPARRKADQQAL